MTPRCLRSGAPRGRTAFLQPPVVHLRQRLQRRAHSALAASASAQPSTVSEASTSTPCWQKLEAGCWLGSVEERRGARGAELIGDAILAKKFKAHDAALTAAMIVKDERGMSDSIGAALGC